MTNKDISRQLKLLSQLMELHAENAFKTKAYANASFQVAKYPKPLIESDISTIPGIGKSMVVKIESALKNGVIEGIEEYLLATPTGVLDMLEVKGIGASKVRVLWKEYEIDSLSKLLEACEDNQIAGIKGFGEKTQSKIIAGIQFKNANAGKLLYAEAEALAFTIQESIQELHPEEQAVYFSGALYTKDQVVNQIDFLIYETVAQQEIEAYVKTIETALPIHLIFIPKDTLDYHLLKSSADPIHLKKLMLNELELKDTQQQIYLSRNLPYVIPEMRNGTTEFEFHEHYQNDQIISWLHLKGALHNHSTYSDGAHSIQQMTQATADLGLDYFGIADHSKTAVYANGLSVSRLEKQWEEINQLNSALKGVQILKGIESDILHDGSLDYPDDVLSKFDYVVASVHSGLSMDRGKATTRLLKAIEHPSTNILGHLSGRLLLRREGYPLDYNKVIDACIANKVAIEINANPWRLDIDWTYIYEAMQKGAYFSINPDAHKTEGLKDMQYGIYVARKAGLIHERVINTYKLNDVHSFFNKEL